MGRLKKYKTDEELRNANRLKSRRYYWKNKEKLDEKARCRYRQKKLKNECIIYKATNILNGKLYIGKTEKTLSERIYTHMEAVKYYNSQTHFHRALRKNGLDKFSWDIIEETAVPNKRERYWIKKYNSFENGYNMTRGGDGGTTFVKGDELYYKLKNSNKLGVWKDGTSFSKRNPGATKSAIAKRIETFKNTTWVSGTLHGNYGQPRLDMKDNIFPNCSKPCSCEGKIYPTMESARRDLFPNNKNYGCIKHRILSSKYPTYFFINKNKITKKVLHDFK